MSHCLIMLNICIKFCQSISCGFRVTLLDSRINSRVVANVDGWMYVWMDVHMDGKPDPYIVPCLRQVQQKGDNICDFNLLPWIMKHFIS